MNDATRTISSGSRFLWLAKREFWEYRGSFLWTPLVIAGVMLALVLMGLVSAELTARQAGFTLNGIHLDQLASHLDAAAIVQFRSALDAGLITLGLPIRIALFFVVFFYALGALYNDRADRSVLFWKSLPLSDTQSVLAKVAAALLIAPALAAFAMILQQIGFLLLFTLYAAMHGVNAIPYLWAPAHLIAIWVKLLLLIPVNALWALPCLGWLMVCSAYARSKPFMWAVLLPIVAGTLVSWMQLMHAFDLNSGWFWRHIVGRMLLSLVPESWIDLRTLRSMGDAAHPGDAIASVLSFGNILDQFATPNFLIGVAAGVAMISAAIWMRRTRVEAHA